MVVSERAPCTWWEPAGVIRIPAAISLPRPVGAVVGRVVTTAEPVAVDESVPY